jgi:hypothetical protein
VQVGLIGVPGTLRVIDEKTVYLRMPAGFMESDTLLMVLRNLLKAAYEREQRGEAPPTPAARSVKKPQLPMRSSSLS